MVQLKYWNGRPAALVLEDGKRYNGVVKLDVFVVYDKEREIYVEGRGISQIYMEYAFVTSDGRVIFLSRNGIHRVYASRDNADRSRILTRRIGYGITRRQVVPRRELSDSLSL